MRDLNPHLKPVVTASLVFLQLLFAGLTAGPALAQPVDDPAGTEERGDSMPTAALPEGHADLTDEGALLKALRTADPDEAEHLERQLQALWSKSGSPAMDLLLRRGRDALENGEPGLAIEHLTALVDHAPDFAEGWQMRAAAYFQVELYGPALSDLEHALALNPNHYNAMLGLGSILESVGLDDLAWEAYSQAHEINPNQEDVAKALDRLRRSVEGTDL
ncbi:tetratricopeptide repeat protein [Chachezhania sediminis]|uniref:tetratricopeptide repeat protein n=1 Tax=Chachezhania sediminis TaxID=2599291 RepID=UPI001E2F8A78|nr:tetratricopeptide repeat protein [Chachezhania sediminis]